MFSELGAVKLKFLLMIFVLTSDGNTTFVKQGAFDSLVDCKKKASEINISTFDNDDVERAWHGCFTKDEIVENLNAR